MVIRLSLFFILILNYFCIPNWSAFSEDPVVDQDIFNRGYNTASAAWGDYDLDGDQDLYVVNTGAPNALYRNDICSYENPCNGVGVSFTTTHTLKFTKMTVSANPGLTILKDGISDSRSAIWVDYDRDGDLDLYVINDGMNRLFINELFTIAKPYDPFSQKTVSQQASFPNEFTYKLHPDLKAHKQTVSSCIATQNEMDVVMTVNLGSGIDFPQAGTVDILRDIQTNYLSASPKVAPGMYFQICTAAGPEAGRRYTVLEVLDANRLRLESEGVIPGIFSYQILRDTRQDVKNISTYENQFVRQGSISNNTAFFEPVSGSTVLLADEMIAAQDQALITLQSAGVTRLATISNLSNLGFSLSPAPMTTAGSPVSSNFKMEVRRKGAELVYQKIFQDLTRQIQVDGLQKGDQIELLSGVNAGKRYTIDSISDSGVVFFESGKNTPALTPVLENILYEPIYNRVSTKTNRIFLDEGANFGVSFDSEGVAADALTRMVKKGDWIVLDPDLTVSQLGAGNPGMSRQMSAGVKPVFNSGLPRPPGVLEVLDILDQNRLLVDAFPSEVTDEYRNSNFPYQIQHKHGRLKLDPVTSDATYFDENASSPVDLRDFRNSLQLILSTEGGSANGFFVFTDLRPDVTGNQSFVARPYLYQGLPVKGYSNYNIQLEIPVSKTEFTTTTGLGYRMVYKNLTTHPYLNPKLARILGDFDSDILSIKAGHIFYLRGYTNISNQPVLLNRAYKIVSIEKQAQRFDMFLDQDLPVAMIDDYKTLCVVSADCDSGTGGSKSQDAFFKTNSALLSVEYEFITSSAVDFGIEKKLEVKADVQMLASGFVWPQIGVSPGSFIEYRAPLSSGLMASEVQSYISSTAILLKDIHATQAPFNYDLALGVTGIKPILRGLISDYRLITSTAIADMTQIARTQDKISYFSVVPGKGLTLVARLDIGAVDRTTITLRKAMNFDPLLASIPVQNLQTSPFYFRITRSTGQVTETPAVLDRRAGLDFSRRLELNSDGSIRGLVLLDIYKTSNLITDPLYKRFRLKSFLDRHILGLDGTSLSRNDDVGSGYFYEITTITRDQGGILENDPENTVSAVFGDWNEDGHKDLYLLNQVSAAISYTSTAKFSKMLYGSSLACTQTTGLCFTLPAVSPVDNHNELMNIPSQSGVRAQIFSMGAYVHDFDKDYRDDLLIINQAYPDRLFYSSAGEGNTVLREIYSQVPQDAVEAGTLRGLNPVADVNLQYWAQGAAVGDLNNDGFTDVYYYTGTALPEAVLRGSGVMSNEEVSAARSRISSNRLYLNSETGFRRTPLPIHDDQLIVVEGSETRDAAIIDTDLDGYMQISVLNANAHYIADPRMEGNVSAGNSTLIQDFACGLSPDNANRKIAWTDVNLDGYPDYYISRGISAGVTNVLCLSSATQNETGNFWKFRLIPRNLSLRSNIYETKRGVVRLRGTSSAGDAILYEKQFDYSYPYPVRVEMSSGNLENMTVEVLWSEESFYSYGTFSSSKKTGKEIELLQPGDFYVSHYRYLDPLKSSPASRLTTIVGPKTTNIEALGFSISAGTRENLQLKSLSCFFAGTRFSEGTAGLIPEGSVKLYLDASAEDMLSDDYLNYTPDGRFDRDIDVEIGVASLKNLSLGVNTYTKILNEKGDTITSESVVAADFTNLVFKGRNQNLSVPLLLNAGKDGQKAQKLSLLLVYTIDVRANGGFETPSVQVLPYIPVRVDAPRAASLALGADGQVSSTQENALYTLQIEMEGVKSLQDYRAVIPNLAAMGVADPSDVTTLATSRVLPLILDNLVGVNAMVDQTRPTPVFVDPLVFKKTKETTLRIFGTGEKNTRLRLITEIIKDGMTIAKEPVYAQIDASGKWDIYLANLEEGSNTIRMISTDDFGNQSEEKTYVVFVDKTPAKVKNPLVTNISIAQARVSFETTEKALGFVLIRGNQVSMSALPSCSIGGLTITSYQCFSRYLSTYTTSHQIELGLPNQLYSGYTPSSAVPSVRQCREASSGTVNSQALCPQTAYSIAILTFDELGNYGLYENLLSFTTEAFSDPRDLDGDGIVDLDADGDGIPDSVESDSVHFPDLDIFDPTDALLDFDNDGVSNIKEYKAGSDMYNPYDILPVANAGKDAVMEPGVIVLDGSSSNFNEQATSSLSFQWIMESAPNQKFSTEPTPPVIESPQSLKTFFAAHKSGTYSVSLQIFTRDGAVSKQDTVQYTIQNKAPVANAGEDQYALINQEIFLDGRMSYDINKDPLTYQWILVTGPSLDPQVGNGYGFFDTNLSRSYFKTSRTGRYEFELIVRDDAGLVARDRVVVFVNTFNDVFPLAHAGFDQVVNVNQNVTLHAELSGGTSSQSLLLYTWQPVHPAMSDLPSDCSAKNTDTSGYQLLSGSSFSLKNPQLRFLNPGTYWFSLSVQESAKGLESAKDCVQILVNPSFEEIPKAKASVYSTPKALSTALKSVSRISASVLKTQDQDLSSIWRVPVFYEVELSGLDSWPDHTVLATANTGLYTQVNSGQDCLLTEQTYRWTQVYGQKVSLSPIISDCSIVKFVPPQVGIYAFDLEIRKKISAAVYPSLPARMIIIAHDPYNRVSSSGTTENNFVPTIEAPKDRAIYEGSATLPSPKCMDPDFMSSPSSLSSPVLKNGHIYPESELKDCVDTSLKCRWKQIFGPTAIFSDPEACSPSLLSLKSGTYGFLVYAYDGTYESLPSEMNLIVLKSGYSVPIANAGTDKNALSGEKVYLDASLSVATSASRSYLWKQTKGLAVVLQDTATQNPWFIPPDADIYEFSLQIQDSNSILSSKDKVQILVSKSQSQVPVDKNPATSQLTSFEAEGGGGGGGCFIATAASGSSSSWIVKNLSHFRDHVLLSFASGREFVHFYYRYSPPVADLIAKNRLLRFIVLMFLYPLTLILSFPLLSVVILLGIGMFLYAMKLKICSAGEKL